MAHDDPFSGLPLSEQAASGKLEQRLFTTETKETRSAPPEDSPANKPDEVEASAKPAAVQRPKLDPRALRPASVVSARFDLHEEALYKATFTFTGPELEALEDLKLELSRQLDSKVTKYDLMRTGLHMMVEDYGANGDRSYVSRKVRERSK